MRDNWNCRIGKVTLKNKNTLHLIKNESRDHLHENLSRAISKIDETVVGIGWFAVRSDGASFNGFAWRAGLADSHFLGGMNLLEHDYKKYNKMIT